MINKVNPTILRHFLCLCCQSKLIIRLTHYVFSISLLFRNVSILNQFHVPLFIINKVNKCCIIKTVSRLVLSIQAYYKVSNDFFLISLLFRIVSSLSQFHVPLFMINNCKSYNIKTVSRHVLSIQPYYKVKSDVFKITLLFRMVSSLNQIH